MASLLVRRDLHPAVQYLLLQAAQDIHSGPGILRRPGQFPAAEPQDVPLSREAHTYYKSGGSFFQRHLPFWLAVIASRLVVVLVPLIGLLYPLLRVLPLVLSFAFERRVNALYAELRRDRRADRRRGPGRGDLGGSRALGRTDRTDPRFGFPRPRALHAPAPRQPRRRPAGRAGGRRPPADNLARASPTPGRPVNTNAGSTGSSWARPKSSAAPRPASTSCRGCRAPSPGTPRASSARGPSRRRRRRGSR